MEENPKTRRRLFQFSLRTFLMVSLLIGLGCGWVGMQLEQKRRHEAVVKEILKLGGKVSFRKAGQVPAWKEWLFGRYAVLPVTLNLEGTGATDSLVAQTREMNLITLDLTSTKITDTGLAHLKEMTSLNHLWLSNTQVTDAGLTHLKEMDSLTAIYLTNTQITDIGLGFVSKLIFDD